MRTIIFYGKPGSGRTTIAAATAAACATYGNSVALLTTDTEPNLDLLFKKEVGARPTKMVKNIDACYISRDDILERRWPIAKKYLERLERAGVKTRDIVDALGIESVAGVMELGAIGDYDVAILDMGVGPRDAIRALTYPENFSEGMGKFYKPLRRFVRGLQLIHWLVPAPIPEKEIFDDLEAAIARGKSAASVIRSPETTVRVVAKDDKTSVAAARVGANALKAEHFKVDALIINMVQSDENPLGELKLPTFSCRYLDKEPVGIEELRKMAADLYRGENPARNFNNVRH